MNRAFLSDSVTRKLLRGGALIFVIKVTSGLAAFAMAAAMARALSVEGYGKFAALLSAALFLGQFATMGQPKLVQRFLGQYAASDDAGKANGLLRDGSRIVLGTALATAAAATLVALIWSGPTSHWLALGPLLIGVALAEYQSHILRSLGRIKAALLPRDLLWRLSVLGLALALIWTQTQMAAWTIILLAGLWLCALVALQARHAGRLARARYGSRHEATDRPKWRSASWGLWGLNVLSVSFPHVAVVAIGFLLGYGEAGSLFAALRIVGLLSMPLVAINLTAGPDIARQFHEKGASAVQAICRSSILILLPVVLVAALVVIALSGTLLALFGPVAGQAQTALAILTVGYLFNALSGSTGLLMQMTGHERRFLAYAAVSNSVALLALFVLVPAWGLIGAAVSVVIASSGWNLAIVIWARRNLGIDPSVGVLVLGAPSDVGGTTQ